MNMCYSRDLNSMQGIGYKEMIAYLEGEISLADAIDMIKQNSRRYAKRQLPWFRRDGRINMLSPDDAVNEALGILKKVELH